MAISNFWLRRGKRRQNAATRPQQHDPVAGVQASPELPHEKDESASSQAGRPRKVVDHATADIARGVVDTDRRSAYGMGDDKGLKSHSPPAKTSKD